MSLRIQKRDGEVVAFNPTKIQTRIKQNKSIESLIKTKKFQGDS